MQPEKNWQDLAPIEKLEARYCAWIDADTRSSSPESKKIAEGLPAEEIKPELFAGRTHASRLKMEAAKESGTYR